MLKPKMNKDKVKDLLEKIQGIELNSKVNLMEVCGTHTVAIARYGIKQLLPKNIRLISGPGCPVCVTDQEDIERFLYLAKKPEVIITTFGDMIRVPGTTGSLQSIQAQGAKVKMVYSALEAVTIAQNNPNYEVVFLAVGFETTTPTVAFAINEAQKLNLKNFSIISMHKLVIPALNVLLADPEINVDGFLCPGHVSSIIGTQPYEFIPHRYQKGAVVAGFEATDILESIYMLLRQIQNNVFQVENQYKRGVNTAGNIIALEYIKKFFTKGPALWRGLGLIEESGLFLKEEFSDYDAVKKFSLDNVEVEIAERGCICGEILKGQKTPPECPLFGKKCTPTFPIGPCMVSSEGSCAASFIYGGVEKLA